MAEIFHFWTLLSVDDIFKNKGMQVKIFPDFFNTLNIMDTVDVYPGNRWFFFKRKTFLNFFNLFFLEFGFIIIDKLDLHLFSFSLPSKDESTWRKPHFFYSFSLYFQFHTSPPLYI